MSGKDLFSAEQKAPQQKATSDHFAEFWEAYPKKVKRMACEKKYALVLKTTTHAAVMAGLAAYKENIEDWRSWADPLTWLNQGRWQDEAPKVMREHAERPKPQYLERKPYPKVTPEERERNRWRLKVLAEWQSNGKLLQKDPSGAYRYTLADCKAEAARRQKT